MIRTRAWIGSLMAVSGLVTSVWTAGDARTEWEWQVVAALAAWAGTGEAGPAADGRVVAVHGHTKPLPAATGGMAASVTVSPGSGGGIVAGRETELVFTLKDDRGEVMKDLAIVHEKPLHVLAVSGDLSWFAHEHPVRMEDGRFRGAMNFPSGGDYLLYFDFTPGGRSPGQQEVVQVRLTAEGERKPTKPLTVDAALPKVVDGLTVAMETKGAIRTGGETVIGFAISKDGKPFTGLRPYLGAMGHLVIISEDGGTFVHAHPAEDGKGGGHEGHAGQTGHSGHKGHTGHGQGGITGLFGPNERAATVRFMAEFTQPGLYKAWGQFNVGTEANQRVVTVPFTFMVAKGPAPSSRPAGHDHGHTHAAGHK